MPMRIRSWAAGVRPLAMLLIAAVLTLSTGCVKDPGGPKAAQESTHRGLPPVEPLQLSIMTVYRHEPPAEDDPLIQEIERYTNTELDITWVSEEAYDDKVSATIASGKLPDVMLVRQLKHASAINAQKSGIFWDILPFLEDTSNIKHIESTVIDNAMVDKHLFGVPKTQVVPGYGLIIRKDWLDNLGLRMPSSVEEIYEAARAFTEEDPDQNGLNDTYGLQVHGSLEVLKQLALYLGAPNEWGMKDGWVMPDFLFPAYVDAMDLLHRMLERGLINRDFPIAPKYEDFNHGKAGMYFSSLEDAVTRHDDLLAADPLAVIDVAQNFEGPLGQRVRATKGYQGVYVMPKSSVLTVEKARRIVDFLDRLGDRQMRNVFDWGIEGVHYTLEDGAVKPTDTPRNRDVGQLKWIDPRPLLAGGRSPLEQKIDRLMESNINLAVMNRVESYYSRAYTLSGKQLERDIYEAQVNYIQGDLNGAGWQHAVSNWRSSGGNKIIMDYTEQYYDILRETASADLDS